MLSSLAYCRIHVRAGHTSELLVSSFSSVAESMLSYVRDLEAEQWDQAQQILQGGIDRSLASDTPQDHNDALKMGLALMEMHSLRRHWPQAVDTASQFPDLASSSGATNPDPSEPGGAMARLAAAAIVAQSKDSPQGSLMPQLQGSQDAFVHHTLRLDNPSPAAEVDGIEVSGNTPGQSLWREFAAVHQSLACVQTGELERAKQVLETCSPPEEHTSAQFTDVADLMRPTAWAQILGAEVYGAKAQLALAEKAWEDAETAATHMIKQIEGSPFKQKWDIAVPLSLLATVYSRTGRVVLAEGVLREATKLLELSKDRTPAWSASAGACHASLPSRVAWQSALLYSALPKRGAEAQTWAEISQSLWPFTVDWATHNGSLEALSGSGSRGQAVAVSGWFGKAFPGPADVK